jgi:hypothetical protein
MPATEEDLAAPDTTVEAAPVKQLNLTALLICKVT